MNVSVLDATDVSCDDFVRRMANAKLCHLPAWAQIVKQTFGHESFTLIARERGTICGVLPLTKVCSRLFGNRIVSQAFSNYGGPLVKNKRALSELLNGAFDLAKQQRFPIIEFRNIEPLPCDVVTNQDKVCMILPLVPDPDKIWWCLKPEIRNRVRKAEKSDLVTTNGGQELLGEFYQLWTIRMRQLGTPCYSESFFRNIIETFPEYSRIFVVRLGTLTVGASLNYSFNGLAQCRWAATRIEFNRMGAGTLLYWSAISHYCLAGYRLFDFGRSTVDSSQYEFKRRWGTKPIQLYYQYWMQPDHRLSVVTPDNPRYAKKVALWKKLPLWVTRAVGPQIARSLP